LQPGHSDRGAKVPEQFVQFGSRFITGHVLILFHTAPQRTSRLTSGASDGMTDAFTASLTQQSALGQFITEKFRKRVQMTIGMTWNSTDFLWKKRRHQAERSSAAHAQR
jgi:hypothetical protein